MQYAAFGKEQGVSLSRIALGTWAMGGGSDWGPVEDEQSVRAVHAALDQGINWIDTAPIYGLGHSEEVLGRALQGRRQHVFLATKCGLVRFTKGINHWLKPDSIRRELEDSLRRLQTDYIDLYQIHWPDPATPLADTLEELTRLKQSGKIRFIGVCNFPPDLLKQACDMADISCVQGPYSLLDKEKARQILPFIQTQNRAFAAYGSLGGGILSGKYKKEANIRRADARSYFYRFYKGENFIHTSGVVARICRLAKRDGVPPAQVALGWVLHMPGVTGVLAGARSEAQVCQNAQAVLWRPQPGDLEFLEANTCSPLK